jgi:hypothetical protein
MCAFKTAFTDRCVIVINSCDAYFDVWPLFLAAFREHWPDCPFRLVLNTESRTFADPALNLSAHVLKGDEQGIAWGGRLLATLADLDSEYVLMLFDDFVLEQPVDVAAIERCLEWMSSDPSVAAFYLSNVPGNNRITEAYAGFEEIPRLTNYRLNSAPALWRRQQLMELTRPDDNPWVWELFGTSRTFLHRGRFFCAQPGHETVYVYNYQLGGAIYRGKWVAAVADPLIRRYGLAIDTGIRGTVAERGKRRSLQARLKMVLEGFKASGWLAPVIIALLLKSKLKARSQQS